ncbi:saccharopine dehydrogenase family protein [Candidatus Hodarchaeum mangrovi]
MNKALVLGGCGAVGSIAVKTLSNFSDFSIVTIGDINETEGTKLVYSDTTGKLRFQKVDANSIDSLEQSINTHDIVINCIGPFYKFGPIILKAAINSRKKYIDINDDVDATREVLKLNKTAKEGQITAIIGMGSSPGVTNLLAKFAEQLLDSIIAIDIYHAHGGEPKEGPGVVFHRIHAMTIKIPIYINGEFKTVSFFSDEGKALEEIIDFGKIGKHRVHAYPHPETITLPNYIKGVKRVTNKGTVLPPEYFYLTTDLVRLGLTKEQPLNIKGTEISPLDFVIAYLINERDKILRKINFGQQRGCVKIFVEGMKENKPHKIIFTLISESQAMGEGTGMPVAFGAIMLQRKLITEYGVLPPEAVVNPIEFLNIMQEYLELDSATGGLSPLKIESIDSGGKIEILRL